MTNDVTVIIIPKPTSAETCYDIVKYFEILKGDGDWFNARLLRSLHDLLLHADSMNAARLRRAFPLQCRLIQKAHDTAPVNWPEAIRTDPEFNELIQ